jgi:hypothetical protein
MKSALNKYLGIHLPVVDGDGGFYVSDQIALYHRVRSGSVVLKEESGDHYALAFHNDLLWLQCGVGAARSLDGRYSSCPRYLASPEVSGKGWVVGAYLDDRYSGHAGRFDIDSGVEVTTSTDNYGAIDATEKSIVLYGEGVLAVYDERLSQVWSLEFDFQGLDLEYWVSERPYICGEYIVVNLGIKENRGRIICIPIAGGMTKWSIDYEGGEIFSFVRDGSLFVSQRTGIQIICIKSGKTLRRIDVSFSWPFIAYPCLDGILVYGSDEAYFMENSEGSVRESVLVPDGYKIRVRNLPVSSTDSVSLYLDTVERTSSPALSAALILSRGKSESSALKEDLAAMFMEVADKHGEKTYILTISEPDLDRLIRLGSIKLLEICCTYGEHTFGTGGLRDKQHKGKIKVVIDREGLPDDVEESLAHWISSIKKYLHNMAIFPGAGERYKFRIDVELN